MGRSLQDLKKKQLSLKITLNNYLILKIYVDFECNLKSVENYEGFDSKKYHGHIPCSFAYKLVCVDDKFSKPIVVFRGKNVTYEFIKGKQFLKNINIVKK